MKFISELFQLPKFRHCISRKLGGVEKYKIPPSSSTDVFISLSFVIIIRNFFNFLHLIFALYFVLVSYIHGIYAHNT